MSDFELVKVHFELEVEDDFPPISIESLNAYKLSNGFFRLDNTPFFAEEVALGDELICSQKADSSGYWYESVASESGNKALSVILIDMSCREEVKRFLEKSNCFYEFGVFRDFSMFAICVDPDSNDYANIIDYFETNERKELLSYAELCS